LEIIRSFVVCCSIFIALTGAAFSQQPSDFESLLASAQQAQAGGNFEAAAQFYRKAVTLQPNIAEIRANLGLMYYQTGNDQQAIGSFLSAIHLKPTLFVPNLFLGLDYLRLKRFSEAIPYLKEAAVLNATDVQTRLALGQAYAGTGKTRLAVASFTLAVELAPANTQTWFHLGVSYLDQVEADARLLRARHSDSGYWHALVGDTFAEQKVFVQAAEAYKTTLACPTFPPGIHAAYGFVLLNQQDYVGAERELNAELASNRRSLIAKLGLARLRVEQAATAEGVKQIAEIWKADPSFLRANVSLFKTGLPEPVSSELKLALEKARAHGEIPAEVAQALQLSPSNENIADPHSWSVAPEDAGSIPKAAPGAQAFASGRLGACGDPQVRAPERLQSAELRSLAACAYSSAQYQAAFDAAQKFVAVPATQAEGLYWEIKSAQKLAAETLARASELDSNSPTLHVLLGDMFRQRRHYPESEQEYRKALVIEPENPGALFGLSLALLADSRLDEALRLAEGALKKNPGDPEFNAVMGEIFCQLREFPAAEPYLKKALNTKPELVPHVHALLGRVYAETNRTKQAIAEMTLGLSDDRDGRLHYQIARLYLKVGDRNSANKALEASRRLESQGLTSAAVAIEKSASDAEFQ
jgi:tetratricopeptide (TPR) repeat protein